MELRNILDICDIMYEYGTYISINDIIDDSGLDKDIILKVLDLLIEYGIIEEKNNKYITIMEYSNAYDTIIKKYKWK